MLKVGIIGAGRIGRVHAQSIRNFVNNVEIVAISDIKVTDELKDWAKSYGINEVYDDYKKILDNAQIEAVLICSSTNTHSKISIEAANAGKHIFCEKPIDSDVNKIKQVIAAVEKNKIKYQVGFNRRFDHNFKALKDAISKGKIGDQHIIRITSRDPSPPPIEYIKVSGGMFFDMTIHDFDMLRYLSNSEVVEVYATGNVLIDPKIKEAGDIDTAVINLKLANGALAIIENSRQAVYGYDQRAEVFGSKGSLQITNDTSSTLKYSSETSITTEKPLHFFLERYMQAYAQEIISFLNAIQNNHDTVVNVNDGLQPVYIALAAKKSLQTKQPVLLKDIIGEYN